MRNAIVAALVLSPLMVHAQANQPAQLQASMKAPASMMLGAAEDRPATKVAGPRISTGVVAPLLIHSAEVKGETVSATGSVHEHTVLVAMVVDEKGIPSDVKLVKTTGTSLDENVLNAVKQFRYKPGTVSGLPVAVPVNLYVTVKEPAL